MIIWQICVVKRLYIGIYFNSTYKSCVILLRTVTISKNGCQIWVRLTNLFYTLTVGSLFGFTHSADWTDFDWYIGIGNDEINNFLCCFSNIFRLIHFLSELSLRTFRIVSEPFHRRFLQITEAFCIITELFCIITELFCLQCTFRGYYLPCWPPPQQVSFRTLLSSNYRMWYRKKSLPFDIMFFARQEFISIYI